MRTLFTGIVPDNIEGLRVRYGGDIVVTPLIDIVPVEDDGPLRQVLAGLAACDYLLFTSRHAVRPSIDRAIFPNPRPRIVAIGATTAAALKQAGITEIERPEADNSYGVVAWFARQEGRGRVLIPRSNLALDIIPNGLRQLGFVVDTVTAYVNRMPPNPRRVDLDAIDRIVFTSPSTIDNFIRLYGALPTGKTFVARGPVTEQYLQNKIKQQLL